MKNYSVDLHLISMIILLQFLEFAGEGIFKIGKYLDK